MFARVINSVNRLDAWFSARFQPLNPYDISKLKRSDLEPLDLKESETRKHTVRLVVVVFTMLVFWSLFAPLNEGINLGGTLSVQGARKSVQHLTGGVVTEIMVKEGQEVEAGQTLLKVNPLTTEANLNSQELDFYQSLAEESRLLSERADKSRIEWTQEFLNLPQKDSRVQEIRKLQEQLFASRREEFESKLRILREQINAGNATLREANDILQTRKSQLETINREFLSNQKLSKEGFVTRARVSEIEGQRDNMIASISQMNSEISRTSSQIASTKIQLIETQAAYRKTIEADLSEVQKKRKSLRSVIESLRFDRELAEIKAPVTGTVVGLKVHTEGGVIRGGDVMMEIVPTGGKLIVQAKVPPLAIDKVFKGLEADVRFSAFKRATTPVVTGTVTLVGADLITPNSTDPSAASSGYYLAQVETTEDGLRKLADLQLQPGMPVEVIVKTGERTFFSLIMKPITDSFARSFNEVN